MGAPPIVNLKKDGEPVEVVAWADSARMMLFHCLA
jgi:hypothetical protein